MTTITKPEIDLFNAKTVTIEQICQLSNYVRSSEAAIIKFSAQTDEAAEQTGEKNYLAIGIARAIAGKYALAAENLERAGDSQEKYLELAYVYRKLSQYDKALAALDKALANNANTVTVSLEKANVYRLMKDFDSAHKHLQACKGSAENNAQYHYTLARCLKSQGLYAKAVRSYTAAVEINPTFSKALFHLAFILDLRGDEDAAMDYYKQLLAGNTSYVSALLNLTVLYEDKAQYDKALKCVEQVLKFHPNNARAILFKKDILGSENMLYDEESIKNNDQKNKMLETPITDFELSVRSRNCLQSMGINTLGDLTKTSEQDLLGGKNFGETSLHEIREMMTAHNLRIGQDMVKGKTSEYQLMTESLTPQEQLVLNQPISDLNLSVRARKCMTRLGIMTIGELLQKTPDELLGSRNFGVTSLNEIRARLGDINLQLRND